MFSKTYFSVQVWPWFTENIFTSIVIPVYGMLHTTRTIAVFLTLSVNFERFYAIVFPLKHFGWKKYLLPGELNRVNSRKGYKIGMPKVKRKYATW